MKSRLTKKIEVGEQCEVLSAIGGKTAMMGFQGTPARLFYDFCLDEHVPSDHLLRGVDRHLALDDLRQSLKPFYSQMGRPSVDPQLILHADRRLLHGYAVRAPPLRRGSPQSPAGSERVGGTTIWSIEHCRGGLSGLKRSSLVPWRNRFPVTWSYRTSTTSSGRSGSHSPAALGAPATGCARCL